MQTDIARLSALGDEVERCMNGGGYRAEPSPIGTDFHGIMAGDYPPAAATADADPFPFDRLPESQKGQLPPFPVDDLPGPVIPFVRGGAAYLRVDPGMVAIPVLGMLSAITQGVWEVQPGAAWFMPVSLFLLAVARSGENKSGAFRMAKKPLKDFLKEYNADHADEFDAYKDDLENVKEQIQSVKKKLTKAKPPEAQGLRDELAGFQARRRHLEENPESPLSLYGMDATPEALVQFMKENGERTAILSDEPGTFATLCGLRYSKTANIDCVLEAFDGGEIHIGRKGSGNIDLDHPALSICIMSQSDIFMEQLNEKQTRGRGLFPRFLIAFPEEKAGTRDFLNGPKAPPPEAVEEYGNLCRTLLELTVQGDTRNSRIIRFSDEAEREMWAFRTGLEPRIRSGELGDEGQLESWTSKLAGNVARIAALIHLSEWQCEADQHPLDLGTFRRAERIGEYFTAHAKYAFNGMDNESPQVRDARYIWRRIRASRKDSFPKRELLRLCNKSAEDLDPGLQELIRRGYLTVETRQTGRRPAVTIRVTEAARAEEHEK